MKSASVFQCRNSKADWSWRHKGNSSLRVVANPTDTQPMQVGALIPLSIKPNVGCPENRSRPRCQVQIDDIIEADAPSVRSPNEFCPVNWRLQKEKISRSEAQYGGLHPLGVFHRQEACSNSPAKSIANFQQPMEWHNDSPLSNLYVPKQSHRFPHQIGILSRNFCPKHCKGRISNQPISPSFRHLLNASLCCKKISSRLNGFTFLVSRHKLRNSCSISRIPSRLSCRHFLRVFSGSIHPMTGISFPSTTIVPTIFGLLFRLRFSATSRRLLSLLQFCHQLRKSMDEIRDGGEC